MSRQRYRHTQNGWATIAAMIAVAAFGAGALQFVFAAAILSLMGLFSTLTVVVDDPHLHFRGRPTGRCREASSRGA